MSRLIAIFCLSLLLTFNVRGEGVSVISGVVKDGGGKVLNSVMVRATFNGKSGPFVMTDANGAYAIRIESDESTFNLSFSKLGYEQEKVAIENKSQRLDIMLSKSAETLPEVTVSTPDVSLRGDTLSFLLSAFAGKDDVSLKDALKKVPGVEVAASGEISYNGKKISNFYIEGMDLMGGKYDIATTNIPASYVNAIEILNNHKDKKIDRDLFSDKVALNVRLKPKAKFRPTGTYSASAGVGETPIPLAASGAGMMFRDKFQSILTLKGSDIKEFSRIELHPFLDAGRGECEDYAGSILGKLSASSPPLSRSRWIKPIDASATTNFLNKISDDVTLRTDAGYSFLKTKYDYSDARIYFDGNNNIVIDQFSQPQTWSHNPSLSLEYKVDKDKIYFVNYFTVTGSFSTDANHIATAGREIREKEKLQNFDLCDKLHWSWKKKKWRLNFSSTLEVNSTPQGYIDISGNRAVSSSENGTFRDLFQQARSYTLNVREEAYAMREFKRSHIFIPIDFSYTNYKIRTDLYNMPADIKANMVAERVYNHLDGYTMNISASPTYQYTAPYDKFFARVSLPITLQHINWSNSGSRPIENIGTHLLLSPSIYLTYKPTAKSSFRMQASYKNSIGDILDLLTAPVMRDYLSASFHSGFLSKRNRLNTSLHYDFKLPLSFWYFNADVAYSNIRENLISRQNVGADLIETSDFAMPHNNERINASLGISKNIRSINAKVSLKVGVGLTHNKLEQNGQLVGYQGGNIFISPSITSQPLSWLGLSYEGDISSLYSRYLERQQSFDSQNHNIGVSFYPFGGFQIKLNSEIIRKEIEEKRHQTVSLFDIRMAYKFKKMRLSCDLSNILNRKSYSYTIFSGIDRFSYNYHLRGREIIVSLEYHL
ncbi:MAG: carboxypeptidase-like regulatory domain-containing protein [Muribaculaceae bacterium]|nr:carboxypeptidase-like regulatory domain-containing protein [Muribaculaceae bacterium]